MLINKTDLLPHVQFDVDAAVAYARRMRPELEVICLSATTGEGVDAWLEWLERGVAAARDARDRRRRRLAPARRGTGSDADGDEWPNLISERAHAQHGNCGARRRRPATTRSARHRAGCRIPTVRLSAGTGSGARRLGSQRCRGRDYRGRGRRGTHRMSRARPARPGAALARVDSVALRECAPERNGSGFAILESGGGRAATAIGPDSAICGDCLREMLDPRRSALPVRVHQLHELRSALHDHAAPAVRSCDDQHGSLRAVRSVSRRIPLAPRSPLSRRAECVPRVRPAACAFSTCAGRASRASIRSRKQ